MTQTTRSIGAAPFLDLLGYVQDTTFVPRSALPTHCIHFCPQLRFVVHPHGLPLRRRNGLD
jgi:hypothetical protein